MASSKRNKAPLKAIRAASTPEVRAKAVATYKRRREEKKALLAREAELHNAHTMSFEAIPDRAPKEVERGLRGSYKRREKNGNNVAVVKQLLLLAVKLLEET